MPDDPFAPAFNDQFGNAGTVTPNPFAAAFNSQFLGQPVTPVPPIYPPFTPAPQRTGTIPRRSRFGVIH